MTDEKGIAEQLRRLNEKIDKIMPSVGIMIKLQKLNTQFDELEKRFDDLETLVNEIAGDESLVRNLRTDCIGTKELKPMSPEDCLR